MKNYISEIKKYGLPHIAQGGRTPMIVIVIVIVFIVDSFAENYKNRVWKGHFMMVKQKGRDREQERAAKANTR